MKGALLIKLFVDSEMLNRANTHKSVYTREMIDPFWIEKAIRTQTRDQHADHLMKLQKRRW